jgi:cold shock CspA family protein
VVSAFDERMGIGVVTGADGAELTFHAVAIADGSRSIAVGTEVTYEVVPALLGRWEAAALVPFGECWADPSQEGE